MNPKPDRGVFRALIAKRKNQTRPERPLPSRSITADELADRSHPVVYRLGHSTVLIRIDGEYFLTDPVFSKRASPVPWIGPKRFQPAPIRIDELPRIKAVVISHDHYDHLDKAAIKLLADEVEHFVVPSGVGRRLQMWGVDEARIIERGWWEDVSLASVTLTATPTQHFTGRGFFDRNKTLAASWVIEGEQCRLFFGGDSGYFPGFAGIGRRFGGFDLTILENGAYSPFWKPIHMTPEETMQAHLDLEGRVLMPIHNGTFDLAFHDWFEPMERLRFLAMATKARVTTPMFGEPVCPIEPAVTRAWWRELAAQSSPESAGDSPPWEEPVSSFNASV